MKIYDISNINCLHDVIPKMAFVKTYLNIIVRDLCVPYSQMSEVKSGVKTLFIYRTNYIYHCTFKNPKDDCVLYNINELLEKSYPNLQFIGNTSSGLIGIKQEQTIVLDNDHGFTFTILASDKNHTHILKLKSKIDELRGYYSNRKKQLAEKLELIDNMDFTDINNEYIRSPFDATVESNCVFDGDDYTINPESTLLENGDVMSEQTEVKVEKKKRINRRKIKRISGESDIVYQNLLDLKKETFLLSKKSYVSESVYDDQLKKFDDFHNSLINTDYLDSKTDFVDARHQQLNDEIDFFLDKILNASYHRWNKSDL